MADLVLAYDILNETQADAVPVQSNFERTEAYVNGSVIRTDGATVMTAPLRLFGDPVSANDAVRKGFLDLLMPVGVILPYGGSAVPGGLWALANGADMSTTVYPDLFNAISYNFGGAGSTFKLPDLRGRTMIGQEATAPFTTLGAKAGSKNAVVPYHNHTQVAHSHSTPDHTHPGSSISIGNHQHLSQAQTVLASTAGSSSVLNMNTYAYNNGLALQDSNGDGIPDSGGIAGMALTREQTEYVPAQWSDPAGSFTAGTATPNGGAGTSGPATPTNNVAGTLGNEVNANLPPYIVINFIVRVS